MTEVVFPRPFNNPLLSQLPKRQVLVAKDTFSRPNTPFPSNYLNNPMGSTEVGNFLWSRFVGPKSTTTWGNYNGAIVDGQMGIVVQNNVGGRRYGSWFDYGSPGDVIYKVKFKGGVKDTSVQIVLRGVDEDNHWLLSINSDKWMLYARVNADASALIQPQAAGYASNDDALEVRFIGSLVQLYLNGVLLGETTSNLHSTGTKVGLVQSFIGAEVNVGTPKSFVDDFEVYRLADWA